MKEKAAKIISIITAVPFISFLVLTLIFNLNKNIYGAKAGWYFISLLFLTLIPLSAYPLANYLPAYRERGREGERSLAFIMGVAGQFLGIISAYLFQAPQGVKIIFGAYFLSGLVLSFTNAILRHKASGHACGVAGPFTILVYFLGLRFWYTYLILPLVYWARLTLKRHTPLELFSGTLIGLLSTLIIINLAWL